MHKINILFVAMLGKFQLYIIFTWIKSSHCEYPVSAKVNDHLNACEPSKSSRLVEHFFNMIFTEFHTTPPVCTCVQMCPDQPAYCYPNGCMKKNMKESDTKSSHEQFRRSAPTNIEQLADIQPVRLFIEDKDDFLSFFEKTHRINSNTDKPVVPVDNNLRPSIFKDRYNMLIKYKRMPKVELKYNLREQVRTMKSAKLKIESIDVSKTRWPHPKQNHRHQNNVGTDSETLVTNIMETNPTLINKGFAKRENTVEEESNKIPTLQDASNPLNTSIGSQVQRNSSVHSTAKVPPVTNTIYTESESNETATQNKTYFVLRLGETNDMPSYEKSRKLGNFHSDSSINLKEPYNNNTYNDMIASLFKSIGKEERSSMEIEQRYVEIDSDNLIKTEPFQNNNFNQTSEINTKSKIKIDDNSPTKEITNATASTKL